MEYLGRWARRRERCIKSIRLSNPHAKWISLSLRFHEQVPRAGSFDTGKNHGTMMSGMPNMHAVFVRGLMAAVLHL
jgi:hypothetical protein